MDKPSAQSYSLLQREVRELKIRMGFWIWYSLAISGGFIAVVFLTAIKANCPI